MYTALVGAQLIYSDERTVTSTYADKGTLTLKYRTYYDGAPGLYYPLLKATLEVEDVRVPTPALYFGTDVWDETTNPKASDYIMRLCMEFGKKEGEAYKTERDRLRFVHFNNITDWESMAESASVLEAKDNDDFNNFCSDRQADTIVDRDDTGVVVRGGTFDKAARKASVEFIRPFDVSADYTLTLKAGTTYKLWMNWAVMRNERDYSNSMVHGDKLEADGKDWEIITPPANAELMSAASSLIAGSAIAAALMLVY